MRESVSQVRRLPEPDNWYLWGYFCCARLMIIVSWNIRGLGKLEKRPAVRKLVKKYKVDLLLLQETKISKNIIPIVRDVWGAQNCGWEWAPS